MWVGFRILRSEASFKENTLRFIALQDTYKKKLNEYNIFSTAKGRLVFLCFNAY